MEVYLIIWAGMLAPLPLIMLFKATKKMWDEKYDINQMYGYEGIFGKSNAHLFSEEWLD